MMGSVVVVEFPDRTAVGAWLVTEPYVAREVWPTIDIAPRRGGPSLVALHKTPSRN